MALIQCSNCHKSISDKAINCPHCGFTPREINQKVDFSNLKPTRGKNILWYTLKVTLCMRLLLLIFWLYTTYIQEAISPLIEYAAMYIPNVILFLLITPIKKSRKILEYSLWGIILIWKIFKIYAGLEVELLIWEIVISVAFLSHILFFIILAWSYKSPLFTLISVLLCINYIGWVDGVCRDFGFYYSEYIKIIYTIVTYTLLLFLPKAVWKKLSVGE